MLDPNSKPTQAEKAAEAPPLETSKIPSFVTAASFTTRAALQHAVESTNLQKEFEDGAEEVAKGKITFKDFYSTMCKRAEKLGHNLTSLAQAATCTGNWKGQEIVIARVQFLRRPAFSRQIAEVLAFKKPMKKGAPGSKLAENYEKLLKSLRRDEQLRFCLCVCSPDVTIEALTAVAAAKVISDYFDRPDELLGKTVKRLLPKPGASLPEYESRKQSKIGHRAALTLIEYYSRHVEPRTWDLNQITMACKNLAPDQLEALSILARSPKNKEAAESLLQVVKSKETAPPIRRRAMLHYANMAHRGRELAQTCSYQLEDVLENCDPEIAKDVVELICTHDALKEWGIPAVTERINEALKAGKPSLELATLFALTGSHPMLGYEDHHNDWDMIRLISQYGLVRSVLEKIELEPGLLNRAISTLPLSGIDSSRNLLPLENEEQPRINLKMLMENGIPFGILYDWRREGGTLGTNACAIICALQAIDKKWLDARLTSVFMSSNTLLAKEARAEQIESLLFREENKG